MDPSKADGRIVSGALSVSVQVVRVPMESVRKGRAAATAAFRRKGSLQRGPGLLLEFGRPMNDPRVIGGAYSDLDRTEMTGQLWKAVAKKLENITDRSKRANLVLAINAIEAPGVLYGDVLQAFRAAHGQELAAAGFAQTWLVGAVPFLVERLD